MQIIIKIKNKESKLQFEIKQIISKNRKVKTTENKIKSKTNSKNFFC